MNRLPDDIVSGTAILSKYFPVPMCLPPRGRVSEEARAALPRLTITLTSLRPGLSAAQPPHREHSNNDNGEG